MSIEIVMGTMGSGMEASQEKDNSQKSPADLGSSLFSCDPDVARKIGEGILKISEGTVILKPRALTGQPNIMADNKHKAIPGASRSMTSKERLAMCNLTGFKTETNLAVKNDMIDKPRKTPQDILYGKANPEWPIS